MKEERENVKKEALARQQQSVGYNTSAQKGQLSQNGNAVKSMK